MRYSLQAYDNESHWQISSIHTQQEHRFRNISFITVRPRRNEQHFAGDIFKRIFFNENVWISIKKISLKFVPKGPINNIPALVQIMAWRRSGDKPLSEPMMVSLPTHICVTRHQWVIIYDVHYDERTMNDNSVHGALSTEMSKRC